MSVLDDLLASVPAEETALRDVRVGPFWTVIWTGRGAGLASTQRDAHTPHGHSLIRWAGDLLDRDARELAGLVRSKSLMEAALGMAAVNALLEVDDVALTDRNAAEEICQRGEGKHVVIAGHFPFIANVRRVAGHLDVLELDPRPGELAAEAAPKVIPQAEVVALTGTSLINQTFESLIQHCRQDAFVLVLGPTSPLSSVLFDYGVDLIAGTQIIDPQEAMRVAGQGAIFRQMRGVRLVTMSKDS